jgi:UDP-N-acetylglucosamine 3-dehydrogenase
MMQVGLLGAGFIGATHAAAYAKLDGIHLAAVADVNRAAADSLAAQYGARAAYTIEGILDDPEITAVSVCLPTFVHAAAVVAAAERGKHILCEKPLALSLEEVDRMRDAVQRAGIKCMVAQVIRFWPEYLRIREALASGQIGQPRTATGTRLASPPTWGAWFRDPAKSGGALFDLHIHDLDFVFSLFGKPRSVYAVGVRGATGGWDHVLTSLDYGDKKAALEASYALPAGFPFQMSFRLTGDTGCIDFQFGGVAQVDQRSAAQTTLALYRPGAEPELLKPPAEDGYQAEIRYFTNCLLEDHDPVMATLAEAREVLTIALAAKQSLETGAVVSL